MNEGRISTDVLMKYQEVDKEFVDTLLMQEANASKKKIIVLDDDPTGVQTVHDISVYTDWSIDSIRQGFAEENNMFFLLTNSRGFTEEQTIKVHKEIAQNIDLVKRECGKEYLIICRGDSTLRGHYLLEPQVLREELRNRNRYDMDGEIICPYFKEGGRFTLENVHYVKYGNELVPAGETEFAKDSTFGYKSSNLCEYVLEKDKRESDKKECICITLSMLRGLDFSGIEEKLCEASDFRKIIVNAVDDYDVKIFSVALYRAMSKGKHFIIRSAAALIKALGNIADKKLLTREEMVIQKQDAGGVIIVGSYTQKTTAQLEELKKVDDITFIEMNSDLVLQEGMLEKEVDAILKQEEQLISAGKNVCVYTKRTLLRVDGDTPEQALLRSVAISDALQNCVGRLQVVPSFIIAKGGITSSDIGTKALHVKKAKVLGQVQPGIPVWKTDKECRFPGMPYVIFPGNVGDIDTLRKVVEVLKK